MLLEKLHLDCLGCRGRYLAYYCCFLQPKHFKCTCYFWSALAVRGSALRIRTAYLLANTIVVWQGFVMPRVRLHSSIKEVRVCASGLWVDFRYRKHRTSKQPWCSANKPIGSWVLGHYLGIGAFTSPTAFFTNTHTRKLICIYEVDTIFKLMRCRFPILGYWHFFSLNIVSTS